MTTNEDLQELKTALTRQLEAINDEADRMGCSREVMRTPGGDFVAAPVLVALAHIEVALAATRPYAPRSD